MLMKKDFHPVHFEALQFEKLTGKPSHMKDSTQKIYMFSNGYGASVIQGFMSFGVPELCVIFFENEVNIQRSHKKRLKKKALKKAGNYHLTYDTPVTGDIKRYSDFKELQRDLHLISKLKA